MNIVSLVGMLESQRQKIAKRLPWLITKQRGSIQHYLFSVVLMAVALWLRLGIAPVNAGLQYVTFFPAVTLAAVAGGFLPGLFATAIGLVFATFIFTPPYYSISFQVLQASFWSNLVFLFDGIIVSFSIDTMYRYRDKYVQELQQATEGQAALQIIYARAQAVLQRNQALLQNSMEGIHIMDIEGDVIEVNDAFCTMLGYTREEALRLNVADWDMRWSRAELVERLKGFIGKSAQFETQHSRKDGTKLHVEVVACGVEIAGCGYIYAASRDITERKEMEIVLKKHKQVIDSANDGFWMADMSGHIREVNESYAHLSGYTREELIGMHISQLDAIDKPEDVAARAAKIIAKGHERFETHHRHKAGHLIDIDASVTFMPETQQFFVFCRDITERKKADDALRVAAVAFETHEAIVITDTQSNIVRVNRAFSEITGYAPEEVLGKNPRIMRSGRHDRPFYIEMWQQLLHAGHWAGEIFDRRKNGEVYPKWMTITAVRNPQHEVTHYVAIFSDITARKRIEEEIHNLAFYDALTKLPNRRLFLDRFRTAQAASARRDDYGAILFIDMDRFKVLNDTLGHDHGDLLLVEVGQRIKSCVREMDTVARFGGDEFIVLIEAFSLEQEDATHKVAQVAEKIREALARPYILKEHEHHSSPSIGISLYHGNDESMDSLIEHADMAMYQAKKVGRNAVCFFDPVMQHDVAVHDVLENDLHHAIELQQLHLHYQIQVDNDNRPLGAEAFLRWEHPQHGVIMPGEFIPLAEESGLIISIGHWVLQTACRQLALWGAGEKTRDLTLTVNISAKQFAQADFVAEVADVLKTHRSDPARLKLELSERLVLTDINNTMDKIRALRNLGIRLSMDNFATVYSSLSYLKHLSSDQLKIHREFVQGIAQEGSDAQLVQTVIDLAKSMDLDIFAEGVETEAQRVFLKSHACDSYQGYLFGKPVPIEEFEKLLADNIV